MNIKRPFLLGTLMLSMGMASIATARPYSDQNQNSDRKPLQMRMHHDNKFLTKEQKGELRQYMKEVRQQISPIMKEKQALKFQLMGKIATSGIQWKDVSGLVDEINAKDAQINTILAKTQLKVFQKFGVMLPPPHHKHKFKGHKGF